MLSLDRLRSQVRCAWKTPYQGCNRWGVRWPLISLRYAIGQGADDGIVYRVGYHRGLIDESLVDGLLNHLGHLTQVLSDCDLAGSSKRSLLDSLPTPGTTERLHSCFPVLFYLPFQLFLLVVLKVCFRHLDDICLRRFWQLST